MDNCTAAQFAESVRTTIGAVSHFYSQIDRLNAALKDALTSGADRFTVLGGIPPQPGKRPDARVIRFDYGALYDAGDSESEEDVDEEAADDDVDEDLDKPHRKGRVIELEPQQPVLPVRALLYDPRRPDEFEPQIVYAILGEWRCGPKLTLPKKGEPFRLRPYKAQRIVRTINHRTDTPIGDRLATRAAVLGRGGGTRNPDRELSAKLVAPIRSKRVFELDGAGAVEKLADDIKAYWQEHVACDAET